MLAPAGRATFRNGCAWFLTISFTSVSDLPSDVTMRRDLCAFGNGGKHAAVGEAHPLQRQRRSLAGLLVIAERRLRREMRQRPQIRIRFFHVHALQAAAFGRGEFHGARRLRPALRRSRAAARLKLRNGASAFSPLIERSIEIRNWWLRWLGAFTFRRQNSRCSFPWNRAWRRSRR